MKAAVLAIALLMPLSASAQNVAITNVRIVVGSGQVIESGTIIVRDGKIVTVTGSTVQIPRGLQVIDGKGMSAMPGFIDGHKHLVDGPTAKAWMQSLLEAGYTTVLIGGGAAEANLALARKIESGEYNGPRAIPSGAVNLRQTPADARAAVQALAKLGIKHTGEIALTPEPAPPQAEIETLKAIVDEAKKVGRSEEHTSELQSRGHLVCRLLLEKKKNYVFSICQSNSHVAVAHLMLFVDL